MPKQKKNTLPKKPSRSTWNPKNDETEFKASSEHNFYDSMYDTTTSKFLKKFTSTPDVIGVNREAYEALPDMQKE